MRRYLLFGGPTYYSTGGLHDLLGDYDDVEAAEEYAEQRQQAGDIDWWHVWDCDEESVVIAEGNAFDRPPGHKPPYKHLLTDPRASWMQDTTGESE